MRLIHYSLLLLAFFLIVECDKTTSEGVKNLEQEKSSASLQKVEEKKTEIFYHAEIINHHDSTLSVFQKKYTQEEIRNILAINRLDFKNRWRADTLVVPNKMEKDFNVNNFIDLSLLLIKASTGSA